MPNAEPHYPCPVCLGVQMAKQSIGPSSDLILDHCQRCGGIWFDYGEVQGLHQCRPQALWQQIEVRQEDYRMQCHACYVHMERNAAACPACGWQNIIDCPVCDQPLQVTQYEDLTLDLCKRCKGIWFDHIELSTIWNLEVPALRVRQHHLSAILPSAMDTNGLYLLDALSFAPDLIIPSADAIVQTGHFVGSDSAELIEQAPEAAASLIETTGDLAGSVFESIANIISGLFDAFDG